MPTKDNFKIFVDYSKSPKKNYETKKIVYDHIDEIWSVDLAEYSDYKISNNKVFRCIFITTDKFTNYALAISLKNK